MSLLTVSCYFGSTKCAEITIIWFNKKDSFTDQSDFDEEKRPEDYCPFVIAFIRIHLISAGYLLVPVELPNKLQDRLLNLTVDPFQSPLSQFL